MSKIIRAMSVVLVLVMMITGLTVRGQDACDLQSAAKHGFNIWNSLNPRHPVYRQHFSSSPITPQPV